MEIAGFSGRLLDISVRREGVGGWDLGGGLLGKVCTRAWATPVLFLVFRFCFPVHVVHEDDREAFLLDGLTYMA